ncbi:calcium-activated chloride channel regulator 1-like [Styela clava]
MSFEILKVENFLLLFCIPYCFSLSTSDVKITDDGGYTGVVIAINSKIEESDNLIQAIKTTWTEASRDLYVATKNLAYFKEITILLPRTWNKIDRDPVLGKENYDQADVIIAPENPSYGDSPYTLQYGGCGEPGIYTHFTPEYLQNEEIIDDYGEKGKVVVHEWAHYRWGVFDETSSNSPFYWDPNKDGSNGPEATRCPLSMNGEVRDLNSINVERKCTLADIDPATNTYPDNCLFFPYEDQFYHPNSSMMCYQYMKEVTTFCEDGSNANPNNLHNPYAPNDQNRLCNMKSTWTVIMESEDFMDVNNKPSIHVADTRPIFKIVRPQEQRFVLVLDSSRSMEGYKQDEMRTAAYNFITVAVPRGSYVGIVEFGTDATTLSELKVMNSSEARETMTSLLPTTTGGQTCIGCGIRKGIEVLEKLSNPAGGHIIVITDGWGFAVDEVYDDVLTKGIVVSAIYIKIYARQILSTLSIESGGSWYYTENEEDMQQALKEVASFGDKESNSHQIQSKSFYLPQGRDFTSEVFIDHSIGLDTSFVFTWSKNSLSPPIVHINSPSGCVYTNANISDESICNSGSEYILSPEFLSIKFNILGNAEAGKWAYSVKPSTNEPQDMTSSVTSSSSGESVDPIVVSSGISNTDVTGGSSTVVYAKVTQGYKPILGAIVEATVSRPSGGPVVINLYDNGAGADINSNDGIYSKYFTEYSGRGNYAVKVEVRYHNQSSVARSKSTSRANYKPGVISVDGSVSVNPHGVTGPEGNSEGGGESQAEDVGDFTRVVSTGGFSYTGPSTAEDTIPPGKIVDLKIQQKNLSDPFAGVILTFTAPGNDYDAGTASRYDISYTYDDPSLLVSNFYDNVMVTDSHIIEGDLNAPSNAGSSETMIIQTPIASNSQTTLRLAIAVKAVDSSGNVAETSNVPVINFFVAPPGSPTVLPPGESEAVTTTKSCYCPVCDPNTNTYVLLTVILTATTAASVTAAIVLGILLCHANKRMKKKGRSHMEGITNSPYATDGESATVTSFTTRTE